MILERNKIIFISLLILILGFSVSLKARALETSWPPSPMSQTTLTDTSTLTDLVEYLYEWGIFLGGIAVFIALLIGGFLYLTSAGDPGRMREAKDRIFSALIGLVLLFSIYLILNTINPELTVLTTPTVSPPGSTLSTSCDTNADCPASYECKNDPTPGDGEKEGTCFISFTLSTAPCEKAILYTDSNYSTVNTEITSGAGCTNLTTTTVKSVEIIGGCTLNLYSNTDCLEPPTLIFVGPSKTNLESSPYGTTEFKSVGVGGGVGGSCTQTNCGPCERWDWTSCSCVPTACCLKENSLILTLKGFKKIEDLKIGDYVIGYENGKKIQTKILEKSEHIGEFKLYFYKGTWFTGNHVVYTDDYKEFKPVSELSNITQDYQGKVYNIQTETHNYFGENDLLIHNK